MLKSAMKAFSEFLTIIRSLVIFLALLAALFWLMVPSIPGIHGISTSLVGLGGMFVFYELVEWIHKWKSSKDTGKAL
jgi:hypothetical protein